MRTSLPRIALALPIFLAASSLASFSFAASPLAERSGAVASRSTFGTSTFDAFSGSVGVTGPGPLTATGTRTDARRPVPLAEALAGQKMLAQRVVQAYARSGLRVDPEGSAAHLAAAVEEFSAGLAALEATLPDGAPRAGTQDPVRQSIWALAGQWADAQAVIAERPTIHSALRLAGKMDGALATIDRLGIELADHAGTTATTSISALLARQAELSQRIARAYWLRRLGDDSTAGRNELAAAERAMRANVAMLKAHPDRTAHDAATLERIETEVEWLLTAIENDGAQSFPLVVSAAVEQVVAQVADFGTTLVGRP